MADSIATLDLVKKLARAVVSAQESEADAEDARNEAVSALADLKTQVTLDQEASDLVARALGNAVAAPPVDQPAVIDANANGIPDSDEEQVLEEETPVDQPSVVTDGIDVGTANADVEANETKPSEGI